MEPVRFWQFPRIEAVCLCRKWSMVFAPPSAPAVRSAEGWVLARGPAQS